MAQKPAPKPNARKAHKLGGALLARLARLELQLGEMTREVRDLRVTQRRIVDFLGEGRAPDLPPIRVSTPPESRRYQPRATRRR